MSNKQRPSAEPWGRCPASKEQLLTVSASCFDFFISTWEAPFNSRPPSFHHCCVLFDVLLQLLFPAGSK